MPEHPLFTNEDEQAIRQRLSMMAKSRIHRYPPEALRQLLDDARTLRDLLDWERGEGMKPNDDRMTYGEFHEALDSGRAIDKHFDEIRERVLSIASTPEVVDQSGRALLHDSYALIGYLGLMLNENDRLIRFLIRLKEDGRITRNELGDLLGLRPD